MIMLFFNTLAIYNSEKLPNNIKNCQSWYKCLPNTFRPYQKCPKTKHFAKLAKFRQI